MRAVQLSDYFVRMYSLATVAALATLLTTTLAGVPEQVPGFTYPPKWSDDFSGTSVDTDLWKFWTGQPSNGEQEVYPSSGANCQITDGTLQITPQNNGGQWTSCRLESLDAFNATAGKKMRVQAKLKAGQPVTPAAQLQGIWPAFWSLGEGMRKTPGVPWPACGEIDTFESVNGAATGFGTVHCGGPCNDPGPGLTSGIEFDYASYHTWAHVVDLTSADWRAQSITFLLDGREYRNVIGSDVGSQDIWTTLVGPMFMTLNVVVGGKWSGFASASTVSGAPAGMEVQYVAVYESSRMVF